MDNNRTIIPPGPREHCRQQKIARQQHIKQTLWQLRKSDNIFFDNSITYTEDKCTAIAKSYTNNAKHVAINSTHAQRNQPTIRLAQRGHNTGLPLEFCIQLDYTKAQQEQTCQFCQAEQGTTFDATTTPSITSIMLTYDSGANGHYIREQDQCKAGLPIL